MIMEIWKYGNRSLHMEWNMNNAIIETDSFSYKTALDVLDQTQTH